MEHGQVRAILGRHADGDAAAAAARGDPTLLLPAGSLRRSLEARPASEQRALAHDYAALWARTFRTLARHLRGRPERAIALFAEEVYPFLRGDRRAARVERLHGHEARILLPGDLPDAYHCGLLEGFVGLSGATAIARADGHGAFTVAYRIAPADRVARTAQQVAYLRLPLLACAILAALSGIAVAGALGAWDPLTAALVLAGTVAAQAGANTLHELRRPEASPLTAARLPRPALRALNVAAYAAAAACAVVLAVRSGPAILAFALLGLALGVAYARVRQRGLGPVVAGLTYGLLIPAGAMYALGPGPLADLWVAPLVGAPLGFMAAALLLLDNMADRPLDEAGGQRTLAVRLPGVEQMRLFAAFVAGSLLSLVAVAVLTFSPWPWMIALLLAAPAVLLVRHVARRLGDPHALGAARLGTFAFLVVLASLMVLHSVLLGTGR